MSDGGGDGDEGDELLEGGSPDAAGRRAGRRRGSDAGLDDAPSLTEEEDSEDEDDDDDGLGDDEGEEGDDGDEGGEGLRDAAAGA